VLLPLSNLTCIGSALVPPFGLFVKLMYRVQTMNSWSQSGAAFGNACDVFVSTQFLIVIIYQKIKEKNYFP
jgi:hypothetical protein